MYQITNMIIDDDFATEEYVTVQFQHNYKNYSITFRKADLEIMNSWIFEDESSFPTDLPEALVESIREDIKKQI
jgi:hypothetical protein